jgi:hypothetical protein
MIQKQAELFAISASADHRMKYPFVRLDRPFM